MSDSGPLRALESPPAAYAGQTRYTQLEYDAILANASIGIAFTRDRRFFLCNPKFAEMFGWRPDELIGQPGEVVYTSRESYEALGAIAVPVLSAGRQLDVEWEVRRKDGSTFLCRMIAKAISESDTHQGTVWIVEDITAEREADARVRRALAEQELILDNATVGIVFSRNRVIERCNRRFEEMFGYEPGELTGRSSDVLFPTRAEFERAGRNYLRLARSEAYSTETQVRRKDGSTFWCKVVGRAIDPQRPREGSIWIYDDITVDHAARDMLESAVAERTVELKAANERLEAEIAERRLAEQRAQHLADHDALTGLPNRRLLEDRLTQALALSTRNRRQTAVVFVDLDRFKAINDTLGHSVGDALLKEIARRLVGQLREGDTICRIGGDEFVVVLPEVNRSADVVNVAQKLIEQLSAPAVIEGNELSITPSLGISVFPVDGRDAETLIRNADAAMYHAKEMGRANYQFFTAEMNQAASRRLALELDLRRALGKGELRVYYQPIVDLAGGGVAGHEALLRWRHPERGLVTPAEFIQLAEDTGLIVGIGEWVLREACRWAVFIGVERGLPVAVNLSARQLKDPKLADTVSRALQETGLPARLLEIEIAESTAMQHAEATLGTLKKLKELGVSIAIDDFGTSYSSLAHLKRLPVDKLKIDRSFVAELPGGRGEHAVVAAIVALARALGIPVIAEGVETEAQKTFLKACDCGFIQGRLVGEPKDADAAAQPYL
jgi:diguanylate cyclase (GGDEF)-like protein/PAS domain S-box-containing protein